MKRPSFSKLKKNYKVKSTEHHTCSMLFPNTCAIRMSEALVKTDAKFLDKFKISAKNKCPHGYIRGAQDLGAILAKTSVLGKRDIGWSAQANGKPPADAIGKTGIVCYMNIPGYGGQGHIDLWNKKVPVGQAYWKAKTIWMWEL